MSFGGVTLTDEKPTGFTSTTIHPGALNELTCANQGRAEYYSLAWLLI